MPKAKENNQEKKAVNETMLIQSEAKPVGFKEQLIKLRDNWLLILIALIVVFLLMGGTNISRSTYSSEKLYPNQYALDSASGGYASDSMRYAPTTNSNFAPEETNRMIVKNANLGIQVKRGQFYEKEQMLKDIIKSSDAYTLSETNNIVGGYAKNQYVTGYYQIKVDKNKVDAVIGQIKGIGKVTSLNINSNDVTGSYVNNKLELEAEKDRLEKYNEIYKNSASVTDKLSLTDRIFDQERRIKYLEESLKGTEQRVEYSTLTVSISEEPSDYVNVVFVKFSDLIRALVESLNTLLSLLIILLPWIVLAAVIMVVVRLFRRK
jgi:hypothetical protein